MFFSSLAQPIVAIIVYVAVSKRPLMLFWDVVRQLWVATGAVVTVVDISV